MLVLERLVWIQEEILHQYLKATGLAKEPESPLFQDRQIIAPAPLVRTDDADMLKRRLKQAGLPEPKFRAIWRNSVS